MEGENSSSSGQHASCGHRQGGPDRGHHDRHARRHAGGVYVRADCLATNTEYCDRCTHAATQATNVARIKTEGTKGLLQGQVAG